MASNDSTRERAVLAFLEQLIQDREHGRVFEVEYYLDRFPGIAEQIRSEYASVVHNAGAEVERLGNYRLLKVIGEGGQGIVYEALDEHMGRRVALKVLPRALAGPDGRMPAAVAREMEAVSRLDHPGICVVHDAGAIDGHAYLAMRLIRGQPLNERIGDLSAEQSIALIEKVARALHAAHRAGVIHRDVKPSNILVDEQGDPVIVDFGLARAVQGDTPTLTRSGDLVGTPHYLSPERLRGGDGQRDPRGDVWALGVTLYELIAGERPFRGHSIEAVARAIEQEEPTGLQSMNRRIPRDLAVVVQTALNKSLAGRYQSALEFADELARVQAGKPIQARPVSMVSRTGRWMRRNPAPTTVFILLLLGAVAAFWVADTMRQIALQRADAWASAEISLASSRIEQTRLLKAGNELGRSWKMEARLAEAAAARRRALDLGADALELPSLASIRSLRMDAACTGDARVIRELDHDGYALGAVSHNGQWLATRRVLPTADGLQTREVCLYDLRTGKLEARSKAGDLLDCQEGIAVSDDGGAIAVPGPSEEYLDLWDLRDERRLQRLPIPGELQLQAGERQPDRHLRLWKIEFSPDGTKIALSVAPRESRVTLPSPRGFAVWDLATGALILGKRAGTTRYPWLAFSPDSERIVVQPEPNVAEVFDLASASADLAAPSLARMDFGMPVKAAALPTGDTLDLIVVAGPAHGSGQDTLARVRTEGAEIVWSRTLTEPVEWAHAPGMVLDREAERLLIATQSSAIELVDPLSGQVTMRLADAHAGRIESLAWLPSGRGWSSHARAGVSRRWTLRELPRYLEEHPVPHRGVSGGMFSTDFAGKNFAFIHAQRREAVHSWSSQQDAKLGIQQLQADRRTRAVYELLYDPPTERLFEIGPDLCTAWDLDTGLATHLVPASGAEFLHGGFDPKLDLWVIERQGSAFSLVRFPDGVRRPLDQLPAAAWIDRSDRGGWLVATPADDDPAHPTLARVQENGDYALVPFSWPGMPQASELHRRNARISEDGRFLALLIRAEEYQLFVWDREVERLVAQIPVGTDPEWASFDIDSAGTQLAYGTESGRVHLLDLPSGKEWASWQAHQSEVRYLRFVGHQDDLLSWASLEPARRWKRTALQVELAGLE